MSNIASVIMEGVGFGSNDDIYTGYDFSASAMESTDYGMMAVAELYSDIIAAEEAYMVSDVIGAARYVYESRNGNEVDAVALTEGILQNGIKRLQDAFAKFIAKIKDFYNKVIDWFKAMFMNSEKFAKTFGKQLKDKAGKVKGYTYSGFKYDLKAGDTKVTTVTEAADKAIEGYIGSYDYANEAPQVFYEKLKTANKLQKDFDKDKAESASDIIELEIRTLPGVKATTISEVGEDIRDTYRSGDTKKGPIENFEGNSVDTMVSFIETGKKTIDKLQKDLKSYEGKVSKILSKLKAIKPKAGDNGEVSKEEQNCVSHATTISGYINAYFSLYQAAANTRINIYKEVLRSWHGALKGFYNYRGKKEGASADFIPDEDESMESMVLFEGDDADCDTGDDDIIDVGESYSFLDDILEQANHLF
jgi:hypothetical protein